MQQNHNISLIFWQITTPLGYSGNNSVLVLAFHCTHNTYCTLAKHWNSMSMITPVHLTCYVRMYIYGTGNLFWCLLYIQIYMYMYIRAYVHVYVYIHVRTYMFILYILAYGSIAYNTFLYSLKNFLMISNCHCQVILKL